MTPCQKPVKRAPKARRPLRRRKPMAKKAPRRIARETLAEKYYKRWIHTRICQGVWYVEGHRCRLPIQQLHIRDMTGASLKESNFDTITGCAGLHEEYDQAKGYFTGWSTDERKSWFRIQIMRAHSHFVAVHGCRPEDWTPKHKRASTTDP